MNFLNGHRHEKLTRPELSLLYEVNDDISNRRRAEFWKTYGRWIMAGIVSGLIVLGGIEAFRHNRRLKINQDSAQFLSALDLLGGSDTEVALNDLNEIAARSQTGFAPLAKIYAALNSGGQAVAILRQAADDKSMPKVWREFAAVSAAYRMLDNADATSADITAMLDKIRENSKFLPAATEVRGLVAVRDGDKVAAKKYFGDLDGFKDTPPKMRARAQKMSEGL